MSKIMSKVIIMYHSTFIENLTSFCHPRVVYELLVPEKLGQPSCMLEIPFAWNEGFIFSFILK